jgi:hypothetical protein
MIVKSLAAGAAAIAAVGAAASGIAPTVTMTATNPAASRAVLAVFGAPLPLAPAADVPTPGQLTGLLNSLADPGVPFADKAGLVEGGVAPMEASVADRKLQKAARKGELPLSFSVANIQPSGPGAATADVTVSGPQLSPRTMNVTFVDQGSWMLSSASAMQLLQAASGK